MTNLNLASPHAVSAFLKERGLAPQKKFGQNFLCDRNIIRKIADTVDTDKDSYVLEIGMGLGALTEELAERAKAVVTVEIDRGLLAARKNELESLGNVHVIEGDILKTDMHAIWEGVFHSCPFYVCGNLPYYITGRILLTVLESALPIISFTAMVQKEVAERLCAKPGDTNYGAATAYVSYFCKPEICFAVSKNCFLPAPDVDSCIIKMNLENKRPSVPYAAYRDIVRAAFSMRRKTIANNLKNISGAAETKRILEKADIDPSKRAQDLGCNDFCRIATLYLEAGWKPSEKTAASDL